MRGGQGGSRALWRGQRSSWKWEMGRDVGGDQRSPHEMPGPPGVVPAAFAQGINPCLLSRIRGRPLPAPGSRQCRRHTHCPAVVGLQLWPQSCLCLEFPQPPTWGSSRVTSRRKSFCHHLRTAYREGSRGLCQFPRGCLRSRGRGIPGTSSSFGKSRGRLSRAGCTHTGPMAG